MMKRLVVVQNLYPMTSIDCTLMETLAKSFHHTQYQASEHVDIGAAFDVLAKDMLQQTKRYKQMIRDTIPPELRSDFLGACDYPVNANQHEFAFHAQDPWGPFVFQHKFALKLGLSSVYMETPASAKFVVKLLNGVLWERPPQSIKIL